MLDDIPENTFLMKEIFARFNANAIACNEGHDALEIFKKRGNFDAILTDLRMPGMSGQTFITEIRKHEKERNLSPVPIIILTAESDKTQKINCLTIYGANEYLIKPIKLKDLMQTVTRLIGKDKQIRSAKNIMIVEDEEISAKILSHMLSSQGHKLVVCNSIANVFSRYNFF